MRFGRGPWLLGAFALTAEASACGLSTRDENAPAHGGVSGGVPIGGAAGSTSTNGGTAGRSNDGGSSAGEPIGGGPATVGCEESHYVDPACPASPPGADELCNVPSICDYFCESGCPSHRFHCPEPGARWGGAVVVCADPCPESIPGPWAGAVALRFAKREGTCGAFGDLTYSIDSGRLESLACEASGRVTACEVSQRLRCSDGNVVVVLDLELKRFRTVWAGTAFVESMGGDEPPCSGQYAVATQ